MKKEKNTSRTLENGVELTVLRPTDEINVIPSHEEKEAELKILKETGVITEAEYLRISEELRKEKKKTDRPE